MFKIGDFSRLTQVTVKALRHYDRLGLLTPDRIDPTSGYRYYTGAQVRRLDHILALKELGFSLEQVSQLLDADLSPAQLRGMLLMKEQEARGVIATAQERLERIEARLRQIEQTPPGAPYDVALKRVAAERVASLRAVLPAYSAVGALFGELQAYQRRHDLRASAWTAVWHDGEYRAADIHAEATFTTADPLPPHARITQSTLPAVETMACVKHHGPLATVGRAHIALLGWIEANDYRLAGPNRTLALHFAGPDSADGITEIQYPITRTGAGAERSAADSPKSAFHERKAMMTYRPFRFGVVAAQASSGEEWAEKARRVEALGYATLVIPDNIQYTLAPLPALAAAAAATRTLRVGTYVLANDYRNPVMLAKEAATLDLLSGGRFELGIGAGRETAAADNRMLGIPFATGGIRVARLAESLAIIKPLLAGQRASATGPHYAAADAAVSPLPIQQPRLPILVAGSGPHLLALAAREADIVALGISPDATEAAVTEKIGVLREAAGERLGQLEINLNLMMVGEQMPRWIASQFGADAGRLARSGAIPVLAGTTDAMCDTLERRRETLGISYIMVSDELMEALAPVVERLASR